MKENEGVSVVICCYNSSTRLQKTLEHLQQVRSEIPWEVIVVDNNSSDETAALAVTLWQQKPVTKFRVVTEKKPGLMNARICGARESAFSIISFIDDDNWVEPQWIDKVFSIMRNDESLGACGGSSEPVFESSPPGWFNEYAISFAAGRQQKMTGYVQPEKGYLWGAGLTVRKSAWGDLFTSGFQSLLQGRSGKSLTAGEDSELCLALILRGWKLWYEDSLKLKHYMPASRLTLPYLLGMSKGFGKAEVVLSHYREYVTGKTSNKSSWLLQCLAATKRFLSSGLNTFFSSPELKTNNQVAWNHDKAYLGELLSSRKKFKYARIQVGKFAIKGEIKINSTLTTSQI